ncbi:MAG TPA: ABC transporter ATP-binding protein [Vicinamibacteria bacterium]
MAFLDLQNVSKGYGAGPKRLEVLRNVNLRVERGEFVAIVGYSGSGKTTLLSMIGGLVSPDAGTITLDGKVVAEPGPDRGFVFQNYSLLPWLTVYENVALGVDQVFPSWPAEKRRDHTLRHVELVNLSAARDTRPAQLSGGMRQRVAVARALATDPAVLLLDEPLGALDALTRATLQDEIESLWERDQKTVVLVTNDVDEAVLLADRIIPLTAGPAATLGPAIDVGLERPRDRKALNRDPRFKEVRARVIEFLLGPGRRRATGAVEPPAGVVAMEVGV